MTVAATIARWSALFLLMLVMTAICPFAMAVALIWATPDGPNSLPSWLYFLNTWDDLIPTQGEKDVASVAWVRTHLGWYVKTWYWLGLRNQSYGLFHMIPGPTDWPNTSWVQSLPSARIYTASMLTGGKAYFEWHLPYVLRFGWKLKDIIDSKHTPDDRPMFCFQPFKGP
jgi:hypothetical protein